jgi:hypothetical protein
MSLFCYRDAEIAGWGAIGFEKFGAVWEKFHAS